MITVGFNEDLRWTGEDFDYLWVFLGIRRVVIWLLMFLQGLQKIISIFIESILRFLKV